jgi:hypothetical protein
MSVLSIAAMAFLANIAQSQSQPHNTPALKKLCSKLLHSEFFELNDAGTLRRAEIVVLD